MSAVPVEDLKHVRERLEALAAEQLLGSSKLTVHVVFGQTGEYSDRSEWPVQAYLDGQAAAEHVMLATQWLKEQEALPDFDRYNFLRVNQNPYDPYMSYAYTGTTWYVIEVPLRVEV